MPTVSNDSIPSHADIWCLLWHMDLSSIDMVCRGRPEGVKHASTNEMAQVRSLLLTVEGAQERACESARP